MVILLTPETINDINEISKAVNSLPNLAVNMLLQIGTSCFKDVVSTLPPEIKTQLHTQLSKVNPDAVTIPEKV